MLYHRLRDLDARGETVQVGLIATGTFGTQVVSQMSHAAGMRIVAIAELDAQRPCALRATEASRAIRSRLQRRPKRSTLPSPQDAPRSSRVPKP